MFNYFWANFAPPRWVWTTFPRRGLVSVAKTDCTICPFQEKIGDITQLLWGSGLEYRVYSKVEKILYNTVEELYPEVVDYRQEFIKLVFISHPHFYFY